MSYSLTHTGNLTRNYEVARSLIKTRSDEALLLLLGHPNNEIVSAVTGALVNLSGNPLWRHSYKGNEGSKKLSPFPSLLGVLRRSALKNLEISMLICQVLHNLFILDNEKNNENEKNNTIYFNVTIPPLLINTLRELIDCSDDMAETLKTVSNEKREQNPENVSGDMGHIFGRITEISNKKENMRNNNESIKKYLDFSNAGKAVLKNYEYLKLKFNL